MSSTAAAPAVTLTAFGLGRFRSKVTGPDMKVGDVVARHGIDTRGHRVALNGHAVTLEAPVREEDELTVVPRVFGG